MGENQDIAAKVYPNPATDLITIEGIDVETIEVYNSVGQLVEQAAMSQSVDVSSYRPGIYMLIINGSEKVRFIRE